MQTIRMRPTDLKALLRRWLATAPMSAFVAFVAVFPLVAPNDYYLRLGGLAAVSIILVAGLNLIYGYAGQASVAHAAFYGVGAYATGLLIARAGVPFWWAWPAAIGLTAVLGVVVGYPVLRLRGFYLLVATFGFALAAYTVFREWQSVTGGPIGVVGITRPEVAGFPFTTETSYYWLTAAAMLAVLAITRVIVRSPFGRTLTAIREGETPVQMLGVNTARAKLKAFAISTALAGAAGGLFAPLILYVSPDSFTVEHSILLLMVLVIGGRGHQWGAILGGLILVALTQIVTAAGEYKEVLYGLALLGAVFFMPEGIVGAMRTGWVRVTNPRGSAQPTESEAESTAAVPSAPSFLEVEADPASETVLKVSDLSCRFGDFIALDGVDLQVRAGELVGLIGPNGAGKTTVINAVTGLVPASRGTIEVNGRLLQSEPTSERAALGIGRTFQTTRLFTQLSVVDNVLVGLHAAGCTEGEESRRRAAELLEFVGLDDVAQQRASTLPFGRRRLLELVRALAAQPRVLLLDEPAAGLNEAETDRLAEILGRIRETGIAIVLVEHDLRLVLGISDRVVVLASGGKLAEGTPEDVQADERVVEAYIGRKRASRGGSVANTVPGVTAGLDAVAPERSETT